MDNDHYLLHAAGVQKSFNGVPALRDGRLELRPGTVHALCGGNGAGKSTFLNILTGMLRRDGGTISCKGRPVNFESPADSLAAGIAMISQELNPLLDMTVAENLFLGREPMKLGGLVVDYRRLFKRAAELMESLGFAIDVRAPLRRLSLAKRQLVEIAKAISYDSDILIMDEPTSAIGEAETAILFDAIRRLTARGVGVIYVSHRMSEIFSIATEYTIFRNGGFIEAGQLADIDAAHLVHGIVGERVTKSQRPTTLPDAPVMLEARGYAQRKCFTGIDLQVRRGEILGIYGLMGAGRSEFLNAVFGLTRLDEGTLLIDGKPVRIDKPADALGNGLALITEDRKDTGLVGCRSVRENVSLAALRGYSKAGWIRAERERHALAQMVQQFSIRTSSAEIPVQQLSGGNQQKVILARFLLTQPRILLCDEPTRGIDEGTKQQIYEFLNAFVADGRCAIVVSSELDEVMQVSDRIAVFARGRITGTLTRAEASHHALTHLAS